MTTQPEMHFMPPKKYCARCGQAFEADVFFRRHVPNALSTRARHPVCIGCEQLAKDQDKAKDPWPTKIRNTRQRHARSLGFTVATLEQQYGWWIERMVHDAQHAFKNGCPYCYQLFSSMTHGLADLSVDIVNPNDPPYYTTNVRWVCVTCNREKSKTPSTLWGAKLACWDQWQKRQQELKFSPARVPVLLRLPFDTD